MIVQLAAVSAAHQRAVIDGHNSASTTRGTKALGACCLRAGFPLNSGLSGTPSEDRQSHAHALVHPYDGSLETGQTRYDYLSLAQARVLRLGLLVDRDLRVSVLPEREEVFVRLAGGGLVSHQFLSSC